MKVAIIPARGGSKRIPRKNIKIFHGKPMIAWSIEAAKAANVFDRIIVSTDDQEIAGIAKEWGAEVPFIRPAELSDDFTITVDVIAHAVEWLQENDGDVEAACCIYATAPFVFADDIQKGLLALNSDRWAFAFSVTDFPAPIQRSFKKIESGGLEMFFPENFETRSQDLLEALYDAGQFYWGRSDAWVAKKKIFDNHSVPVIIPRWRVQDIDTAEDWDRAEVIAPAVLKA